MGTFSVPEWSFPTRELPEAVAAKWRHREQMGWLGLTPAEALDLFFHIKSLTVQLNARPMMVVHHFEWLPESGPPEEWMSPEGGIYWPTDPAVSEVHSEPLPAPWQLAAANSPDDESGLFSQPDHRRSFIGSSASVLGATHTESISLTFGAGHEFHDYNVLILGTFDFVERTWADKDFYLCPPETIVAADGKYWFQIQAQVEFTVHNSFSPLLDLSHPNGPFGHYVGDVAYNIYPFGRGTTFWPNWLYDPASEMSPVTLDFLGKGITLDFNDANPVDFSAGTQALKPGFCFPHDPHDGNGPIWQAVCSGFSVADFFGKIEPAPAGDIWVPPARALRNPFSWQP